MFPTSSAANICLLSRHLTSDFKRAPFRAQTRVGLQLTSNIRDQFNFPLLESNFKL